MLPIKYTKEQSDFIRQNGSCINGKWYYIPYWFKEVGEDTFELVRFENLPADVKEMINQNRNPQP